MLIPEAYSVLGEVLAPVPAVHFLEEVVGRRPLKIPGDPGQARAGLLGADPQAALLDAYRRLAPKLTSHAAAPSGPPPRSEEVPDREAFRDKIAAFHQRGYTVRLPELRPIAPRLNRLSRALEIVLHQPVEAVAFWSRCEAQAPVHHDDEDLIAIQLVGRKRWSVSSMPSELPNRWKPIPDGPPELGPHDIVEMSPGDLLYLPRGTRHRVEALQDSLHVTIGFTPLTLRDALLAVIDQVSDLDRPFREGVQPHPAISARRNAFGDLPSRVRGALGRALQAAQSDDLVAQSLQRRASRTVAALSKLEAPSFRPQLTLQTRVRHAELATSHLSANESRLDVSYPGGHLYVHRGAEEAVLFILNQAEFSIADVPGELSAEVKIALVDQFIDRGVLQPVLG